jgi:hypothetical protein
MKKPAVVAYMNIKSAINLQSLGLY